MNEYDSARMQDLLNDSHGFETTDKEEEADLILLNTCSIREKAQEKVFHQLGRWKKLKEKNPNLVYDNETEKEKEEEKENKKDN